MSSSSKNNSTQTPTQKEQQEKQNQQDTFSLLAARAPAQLGTQQEEEAKAMSQFEDRYQILADSGFSIEKAKKMEMERRYGGDKEK